MEGGTVAKQQLRFLPLYGNNKLARALRLPVLSLFFMLLMDTALWAQQLDILDERGDVVWDSMILLYKRQSEWIDLAPVQTIAGKFPGNKGKVVRLHEFDFKNTIEVQGTPYFFYEDKVVSDAFLIPQSPEILDRVGEMNALLQNRRSRYEVIGRILEVQQDVLDLWNTAIVLEICGFRIEDQVCMLRDEYLKDEHLMAEYLMAEYLKGVLAEEDTALEAEEEPDAGITPVPEIAGPAEAASVPEPESEEAVGEENSSEVAESPQSEEDDTADGEASSSDSVVSEEESQPDEFADGRIPFSPDIHARLGMTYLYLGKNPNLNRQVQLGQHLDINGSISLTQKLAKNLSLEFSFERDPLLMNRLFTDVSFSIGFMDFEAGLFFGLDARDDGLVFSPGLSARIKTPLFRELLSGAFRVDLPFGPVLNIPNSYTQMYIDLQVDVTFSWARFRLGLSDRTFTQKIGVDMTSEWVRYAFGVEKDFGAATVKLDVGYQELRWLFSTFITSPTSYYYSSVYAGLGVVFSISTMKFSLGLEAPVYPWIYPELQSLLTPNVPLFLGVALGFDWTPLRSH
jgi:hypothetical protein